ncbi:YceI family protein [Streptomyces gamaensis]|uniref:YceI family protein n=1 Tax=Streptomyces gamaensis TaxID=1763542 RepID=A0ABW0YYH7_9ACTN
MTDPDFDAQPVPVPGVYRVDPQASTVRFAIRAFWLFPVRGTFAVDNGEIVIAEDVAESSVTAVLRADSFVSGHARRDEHVRSADYLDVAAYPEIGFHSHRVEQPADGPAVVHGELTVHGATRPATLHLDTVVAEERRLVVRATAAVDRYAFGVTHAKGFTGRRLAVVLDVVATR